MGFYGSTLVNMASMINDIMKQPEFEKMAKQFSEEMKKSFEKCPKTSTEKSSEKNESSTNSEESTSKSSPKSCPMIFRQPYCRPNVNKTQIKPNTVSIPLKRFSPEQVQLNMNKNGLVTVAASRENTEESNRNGQRKITILVEETF